MTKCIYAYLLLSTQLHFKMLVFLKLILIFYLKKSAHIQRKIILFSKSMFKIKVMLGRALFLIFLILTLTFKVILIFKVSFICILFVLCSFLLHFISFLKVCKLFSDSECLANYSADI